MCLLVRTCVCKYVPRFISTIFNVVLGVYLFDSFELFLYGSITISAYEIGLFYPNKIGFPFYSSYFSTKISYTIFMNARTYRCPIFKVLTYYGSAKARKLLRTGWSKLNSFHICITSYQLVVQDAQSFRRKRWYYMALDEAHNIKVRACHLYLLILFRFFSYFYFYYLYITALIALTLLIKNKHFTS